MHLRERHIRYAVDDTLCSVGITLELEGVVGVDELGSDAELSVIAKRQPANRRRIGRERTGADIVELLAGVEGVLDAGHVVVAGEDNLYPSRQET